MSPQDIIMKKRDGLELSPEEIQAFVTGIASKSFKRYQTSALLMAMFLNGLNESETAALTEAMMRSGEIADLSSLERFKADKHSTGGVGDKVSLILAPLAVACGLAVPMISGRGLGHTGGTLDKLESIPGFSTNLSLKDYRKQLKSIHQALIGQTEAMVPADRELYALRDVTGTVESIPLISASIMSKKLAEGIDALVLDVKVGKGAFMRTLPKAQQLARSMVQIGRKMGKPTRALITAMDEPLGTAVGNAVEVREAIACLKGEGPADLMKVTYALTAQMLLMGNLESRQRDAMTRCRRAIESGAALECFQQVVEAQGGDPRVVEQPELLPSARQELPVVYEGKAGTLQDVDAMSIARIVMDLGGGRKATSDRIDPAVGITDILKRGTPVSPGDRLCTLHVNRKRDKEAMVKRALDAFQVNTRKFKKPELILDRVV